MILTKREHTLHNNILLNEYFLSDYIFNFG